MFRKVLGWLEWTVFALLCVAIALAPLAAHLALGTLPGAQSQWSWLGGGVFISWAFLIYFSWICLPSRDDPAPKRLRAWALFLLLELAYPAVSWGLEGENRVYLLADLSSWFATCLSLAAGGALVWQGTRMLRDGDPLPKLLAMAAVLLFMVLPALLGELAWWQKVELPGGSVTSQLLRAFGLVTGVAGLHRNLRRSTLFS